MGMPTFQVMEYPAHDLPVTGLGFAPREAGVALGGYDLLAGSADYKITLFKTQGEEKQFHCCGCGLPETEYLLGWVLVGVGQPLSLEEQNRTEPCDVSESINSPHVSGILQNNHVQVAQSNRTCASFAAVHAIGCPHGHFSATAVQVSSCRTNGPR